jgi:hypothetical protein
MDGLLDNHFSETALPVGPFSDQLVISFIKMTQVKIEF